ncbi:translation initiation factor IF-2 [Aerococcaceae bacterium DSM 111022]|nr:translation initiation factor IF-2 [Aerococcaceae bacterium DSM 111022]
MTKRIYEFAKEHNMSSKAILDIASEQGLDFGSHMSSIDQKDEKKLLQAMKNSNSKSKQNNKKEDNSKQVQSKQTTNQNKASKSGNNKNSEGSNKTQNNSNNRGQKTNTNNKPQNNNQRSNNNDNKSESSNRRGGRRRNNRRRGNRRNTNEGKGITQRKHKDLPETFEYSEGMNIQDIAKLFHRDASEIIMKLMGLGIMANQNQALSKDVIELIAIEYGVEAIEKEVVDVADLDRFFESDTEVEGELSKRPPVVTIMGHVDHGKTTLLDQLRSSAVTAGEAGGITQHIGAYQVDLEGEVITFLDTPGHEAFTTMRARGADVTDIAIIVVAADDGVMPQTVEAINHAKAADVPIIIAVNKIDKPTANPDRVKQELSEYGIISEDWGGDNIFVEISAKFNQNIDELLEMILLVAEVQELTANAERLAIGSVIEARLDKAQGSTATLLVQEGTLHVGDPIVVGETYGRVRTMTNDQGRRIKQAGPATPVEITGLNGAPQAGDLFVVFEDEKTARQAGEERAARAQEHHRAQTSKVTLDNLFATIQEGELKSINVIIKADVQGSVEALGASLEKIEVEGVRVNIVHKAVGAINESDITLANASNAIVIGFNVRPTPQARQQAEQEDVDIRGYRVIYDAIEEIETAMKGLLDPEYEEQVQGQALVRETYSVSKLGTIAGSFVTDGYIARDSLVRLLRDNIVIYEGEISSLKRFKDDAKQVNNGYECGIMLDGYNDIKVDDIIEAYHMVEIERK